MNVNEIKKEMLKDFKTTVNRQRTTDFGLDILLAMSCEHLTL